MKRLLRWFADRRRPDYVCPAEMSWRVLSLFGRHVDVCVVLYGDDKTDNRPADHSALWLVLGGRCTVNGRWLFPGEAYFVRRGRKCNVQLCKADTYEEGLFDLAWMEQADIHYQTEKRLWLLVVS